MSGVGPGQDAHSLERIACHEAGHAIVAWHSPTVSRVFMVSMGGYRDGMPPFTVRRHPHATEQAYWESIAATMGGLAGETVGLRRLQMSGADDDLANALAIAKELERNHPRSPCPFVTRMSDRRFALSVAADDAVHKHYAFMMEESYYWARRVITEQRDMFMRLIGELVCRKHLQEGDLHRIFGSRTTQRYT